MKRSEGNSGLCAANVLNEFDRALRSHGHGSGWHFTLQNAALVHHRLVDVTSLRFAAFISYRHIEPDRGVARWLHGALETYRPPPTVGVAGIPPRLGRVFRDEEELAASPDLSERIQQALNDSDALIVICSPRTPGSQWVNAEIERFRALGKEDRLFALLVEGTPEESFPPALASLGREPLAADLRLRAGESQRSQRHTALLKLLAGLLKVDFDALRRRDEERRRRRLVALAASASVLAAVLAGLVVFAGLQWRRAEDELELAQARRLATLAQMALTESRRGPGCAVCPDSNRAPLLALESLRLRPTVEAEAVLRQSVWDRPGQSLPIDEEVELSSLRIDDTGKLALDQRASVDSVSPQPDDVLATTRDGSLVARSGEALAEGAAREAVAIQTASGRVVHLLPHEWVVGQAGFSDDGRWLVTLTGRVSADAQDPSATALPGSAVRVWDVAQGTLVTEVSWAASGGLDHAAFSPSGRWLATIVREPSVDADTPSGRRALAWPVPPDLLRELACAGLERNLSESEWQAFMPRGPWHETCRGLPKSSE